MTQAPPPQSYQKPSLEFKSSTISVPVLLLRSAAPEVLRAALQEKIKPAPEFFRHSPVIIDFSEFNAEVTLADLVETIRDLDLLPIGIRNAGHELKQQALALNLPVFSSHHASPSAVNNEPKPLPTAVPESESEPLSSADSTILVTQPVRSGQRIYSPGDLVILAQVSAGAEVMAAGNIHIYHTLRGRALAWGFSGIPARIFCHQLEAELISIAGSYKVSEDIKLPDQQGPVQVYLKGSALVIEPLSISP